MDLLVATGNKGKLKEYRRLLAELDFSIVGLDDVGLSDMDVEETETTFEGNAILKAEAYAEASSTLTLADDSGLVVDALDGAPGVYSARYGKPEFDDAGRRRYLLEQMQDKTERSARFVCVIAVYNPETGQSDTVRGTCEGQIIHEERDGGHGFGYDPVFMPDGYDKTFAELLPDVKNRISHRGNAAQHAPAMIRQLLRSS